MLDSNDKEVNGKVTGILLTDFIKKYPHMRVVKQIKQAFQLRHDLNDFITALNNDDLPRAFLFASQANKRLLERLTGKKAAEEIARYEKIQKHIDEDYLDYVTEQENHYKFYS